MRIIAIAVVLAVSAGCSTPRIVDDPTLADEFAQLRHKYSRSTDGFNADVKKLLPQGLPAARCHSLLSRADRVEAKSEMTVYCFESEGQGLASCATRGFYPTP